MAFVALVLSVVPTLQDVWECDLLRDEEEGHGAPGEDDQGHSTPGAPAPTTGTCKRSSEASAGPDSLELSYSS